MSEPIECGWCSSPDVVALDGDGDPACPNCTSEHAAKRARELKRDWRDHLIELFPRGVA
jgi:hypothetical protein